MTSKSKFLCGALCAPVLLFSQPAFAQDQSSSDDEILQDVILVSAPAMRDAVDELEPPSQMALPADAVAIAARAPGAGAIGNGALSGQLSYRGLFGERVLGRVNGQRFASGGPNAMDPPLHYAPSILVERIEIARGVSPVSQGPALANAVNAELRQVGFSNGEEAQASGTFSGQYRSVDDSYAIGGNLGLASRDWRIGFIGSREQGQDYRFPGGVAADTGFERNLYGMHGGFRLGDGEVFAEYRRSETDPSGNPSFAMDIIYFDTDFVQAGYRGNIAQDISVEVKLGHMAVRHLMDNHSQRAPVPTPMRMRATFADADTTTGEASIRVGTARRNVSLGADFQRADKYVRITNPLNADFFLEAQPDLQSQRFGGFVQLRSGFGGAEFELGTRIDFVEQEAAIPALGSAVPMGPVGLANAFSATARNRSDTVFDAVLRVWLPGDIVTPRVTLARKSRTPSLLERFAWLPTQASYGLADGNIYVGNQALEAEHAWIAEAGLDIDTGAFTFRPTLFYRRIDSFIQGTPFDDTVGVIDSPVEMVANMNGDATPLMFRNVDAELFGFDFDFGAELGEHLLIEATASWVRAKRRDIADDLYRVPAANLRLAAIWQESSWSAGAEMTAAADQNNFSFSNDEGTSEGYVVVNLFASIAAAREVTLDFGVENLFNTLYRPHLSGVNRVGVSDVAVGDRMPGAGRGVWVRSTFRF